MGFLILVMGFTIYLMYSSGDHKELQSLKEEIKETSDRYNEAVMKRRKVEEELKDVSGKIAFILEKAEKVDDEEVKTIAADIKSRFLG